MVTPTLRQAALRPVLQNLYDRLDAARAASPTGAVTLDSATLGDSGAAILKVLPEAFGAAEAPFSGEGLSLTCDMDAQSVTLEGYSANTALGLDGPSLCAVFTADAPNADGAADADGTLVMQMSIAANDEWNLANSFSLLMRGSLANVGFLPETDPPPCLVLSSITDSGAAYGSGFSTGLNVRGDVSLGTWPFDALGHLIPGLAPHMAAMGPAICKHADTGSVESFTIASPLPGFSLPATILPALEFKNNRLAFYGRYEMLAVDKRFIEYQASDLCAESEIVLNGISLPLAVYLPLPGSGWGVGTVQDKTVPIGDLAGFLGGFTGVSLVDALPEAVRVLNVFELKTFRVRLTQDLENFTRLDCAFGTVPVDVQDSVWAIIDGVIELHNLDFSITVLRDNKGEIKTSGFIQGSVNLGGSLNVGAFVPLPIGTGLWTFSARSIQPINALDAVGSLFGNNSLSQSLPAGLGSLASYFLQDLSFTFDPASVSLTRVHLAIASAEAWHIVDDQLVVESLYLDLTVNNPMGAGISPYGAVGCALKVGSLHISAEVGCSSAGAPWMLRVSAAPVSLPTLGEMTALLAGQSVADALPDTLENNTFSLFGLEIRANLSTIRVEKIAFGLVTVGAWTVIGNDILVVQNVEVYFDFDWSPPAESLLITGYISGTVIFIGSNFVLSAEKRVAGWDLTAELDTTTPFTLQNAITKFGGDALWQSVAALGVPNVSLGEGRITYATDTGNYSLKGVVDFADPATNLPWTINIGITTLAIRSIGADIAVQYSAAGQEQNRYINVTGAFDIGSVQFKVSYDTSKGVVVDCTLVSDDTPVSALEIATALLGADVVNTVTYTGGVVPLEQIMFSGVHAQIVVGTGNSASSFKLYGTVRINDATVNAVLEVRRSSSAVWGLIVGIKVDTAWSLPGFTDTLESFKFDKQTWMIAATSFTDPAYTFPDSFTMPGYKGVYKYLDFYASFSTGDTDPAVAGVDKLLPTKQLPPSLTVMGVIADDLPQSWLKCMLYADENGVPIFGWDTMRLISVAFLITGEPALALQAVFLYKGIYNTDPKTGQKNYFQLQLSAGVTPAHAFIIASGTDGKPIFSWENALGLGGFTLQLDWVKLGLVYAELGIEGGFQGLVRFCNPPRTDMRLTTLRNALPDPAHVAAVLARLQKNLKRQAAMPANSTPIPGVPTDITAFCREQQPDPKEKIYSRVYDPNEILIKLLAVIAVTPASEGIPIPQEMGGHIVNVTIPYLLKQFVDIDVPGIIQPIQLPDVCFYIAIGPSAKGFEFYFHGIIIIFSWHGEVEALFQLPHIKFVADMDPVILGFTQDQPLIIVARSHSDLKHGPYFLVDSQPPAGTPMIKGNIYCSFLKVFNFETEIEVSEGPPPFIHFSGRQNVGPLMEYMLEFTYQDLNYISAAGGFTINLTDQQGASAIPGFSVDKSGQTYRVADTIDLTKVTAGVYLSAETAFTLNAKPASPQFTLKFDSSFLVKLGKECNVTCHLYFTCDVQPDTLETMPVTIITQLGRNSFEVFGALIGTAQCFAYFLKAGLFILLDAAEAARVLAGFFLVSVDTFVRLLDDIGNSLHDISNWLCDIFGSKDSESNTRAIKDNTHNKYSNDEIAKAVRDSQEKYDPENPYTDKKLMKDQAGAGYMATEAVSALKSVFQQYKSADMASAAGRLAADPLLTKYTPPAVALALKNNYPSKTATAKDMRGLLAQVYTGSASLSAQQMADALAASGYPAADVARVLHDNYPAEVKTAGAMYEILKAAYTHPALDASQMAAALAASPFEPCEVAPLLRSRYPSEAGTADAMAILLTEAYPQLSLASCLSGLAAAAFSAYSGSSAMPAHYAPMPAAGDFALNLNTAYRDIAALSGIQTGAALFAASYDAAGQSKGIKTVQPDTTAGLMAAYLLALSDTVLAAALKEADLQAMAGASLAPAAAHIVAALPQASGETLYLALNSAYSPPNQEAAALVEACAGAFSSPSASSIATGLLLAFPTLTPEQLLGTLNTGFTLSGKPIPPGMAGIAVAAAYKAIGVTVGQSELVRLIVAEYKNEATPAVLVGMLIAAYGKAATVQSVIDALVAGYEGLGLHLCAVIAAAAVRQGFSLTPKDAASTLTALGNGFKLARVPNDVAALGAAMSAGGFGIFDVSAAMKTFYGSSWTVAAYQLLAGVYSQAVFQSVITAVLEGKGIQQTGADMRKQYADTTAPAMTHVLSSAYTLTVTAIGVTPVAQAMKAAGYTLIETSEAMKLQYLPDWTIEDYQRVSEVFRQT